MKKLLTRLFEKLVDVRPEDAAPRWKLRGVTARARSVVHGVAAGGQVQSEEFDGHVRLSHGRSDRRLVLSFAHVDGPRSDGYLFRRGATRGPVVLP